MYCFDTSAFVNPWRRYYPLDLFPSVWEHIDRCIADGSILAAHEVHHELDQKDDELLQYIKARDGLFVPLDEQQQARLRTALEGMYGKKVTLHIVLDPSVVGGIRVQIGDEVVDGTVSRKLSEVRRDLTGS